MLLFKFLLLFVCLLLSAFFSASETALFSLDSIKIKRLGKEGKNTSLIIKLIENPLRSLTSILAGNTLVNVAVSAIVASILIDLLGPKGVGLAIGVTTLILLIFGEVTPKTVAINNNEKLACLFSRPLYHFSRLISPFVFFASRICDAIISALHLKFKKEPTLTEEEFKTIIEVGHRYGVVGKDEKDMIVSVLELTTTLVQEVMTPRTDIKAISASMKQEEALVYAQSAKHSKIPVYKNFRDNIVGILNAKEFFLKQDRPFMELIEAAMFVPFNKKIDELLTEFHKEKKKIAIVVDEHGGTSGLITLEDILEEVFGEIYDEFEITEQLVSLLEERKYRISGKTPVYQVNEDCRLNIPSGEYETIAGFLLDRLGKIPLEGEELEFEGAVFRIERVAGRRIRSVILEKRT